MESSTAAAVSVGRRRTSSGSGRRQHAARDECLDLDTAAPAFSKPRSTSSIEHVTYR